MRNSKKSGAVNPGSFSLIRRNQRLGAAIFGGLASIFITSSAFGQTVDLFDNGSGDSTWENGSNWISGNVPTSTLRASIDSGYTVTSTGTNVCSWLIVGAAPNAFGDENSGGPATLNINAGTVTTTNAPLLMGDGDSTGSSNNSGVININAGGKLTQAGTAEVYIGYNQVANVPDTQTTGTMNVNGGTCNFSTAAVTFVGASDNSAYEAGTLNIGLNGSGGSVAAYAVQVGPGNSVGVLNLSSGTFTSTYYLTTGNGASHGQGTINVTGGTMSLSQLTVGETTPLECDFNESAGVVTVSSSMYVGRNSGTFGVMNLSGGTFTLNNTNDYQFGPGANAVAVLNISGTAAMTLNNGIDGLAIGKGAGSTDTINMSGGSLTISNTSNLGLFFANSNNTHETVNLTGGVMTVPEISAFGGSTGETQTLNLNGGVLVAGQTLTVPSVPNYRSITSVASTYFYTIIGPAGATINTSTNTVTWVNPLTTAGSDGGLTKLGTGTLNLTGSNSFTGPITVSTGFLEGTLNTSLPSYLTPGHIAVASGATLVLAVGGTGQFAASDISGVSTAANFASGASIGVDTTAGNFTYAGNITDTANGSLGFAKLGTNTLVLTGSNTYTGQTYIGTTGTLNVGSATALGSSGSITFASGTPYLQFSAANQVDYSTRFTNNANQSFGIDTNGQNVTFSAAMNSAGGYFNKVGTGTLTLAATGNSTIGFQVNGGTVDLTGTYTTTGLNNNYIYIGNGSGNGGITGAVGTLIVDTNATWTVQGSYADSFVISRDTSGSGTLIQNAGSTINFAPSKSTNFIVEASNNTASVGTYNMNGGTLNLNGNPLYVGLASGTGILNIFTGASITGAGSFIIGTSANTHATVNQNGGTVAVTAALVISNGSGNAGVYNLSGGVLSVPAVTTTGGTSTLNFNGGTLKATAASTTFLSGLTSTNVLAGTGTTIDNGGFAITIPQPLLHGGSSSPDGGMTFQGSGMTTLTGSNAYTGTTQVAAGTLVLPSASAISSSSTLNVSTGAVAQITAHTGSTPTVLQVGGLNVSGVFDISNNDVVVKGAGLAGVTSTTTALAAGYNGGAWNGTSGILSSTAAANTKHLTAVGVATGLTSFEGLTVSSSDELIKYTYYGDANLDGAVDGSDYTLIDNGFNNHLTGWQNGDFNYDGVVDGSDYTLIDNAFNTQGASLGTNPASLIVSTASQFSGASSAVPEPASIGLLTVAVAGGLLRRRRR